MTKLFISYRSLDSTKVDSIVSRLRSVKTADNTPPYSVWQDKHDIPVGQDWWESIANAIIKCDVFVFMVSRESVQNINCRAELSYARKRNRPIVALVLEGEFFYNQVTGKNDIDFWQDIPQELDDLRSQFLFYEGTSFLPRLQAAIDVFQREPQRWRDILADRPLDPRVVSDETNNTVALYQRACDYAGKLDLNTAERLFQKLVNMNDPDFGEEAFEWISLLRDYQKMVILDSDQSTRHRLRSAWKQYAQQFPKSFLSLFDPKDFETRFANASSPAPTSADTVSSKPRAPLPKIPRKLSPLDLLKEILDEDEENRLMDQLRSGRRPTPSIPNPLMAVVSAASVRGVIGNPFEWREVPDGEFLYGKERQNLTLPGFVIAKYPITYSQFQVFVGAPDGFYDDRWWEGLGLMHKHPFRNQPGDQRWKLDTHPRENVSWTEVVSFCRWLSYKLGGSYDLEQIGKWAVRLPTEFEWEKSARGTDGRKYPYGDDYDSTKCNTEESGFGQTTPVTHYPQGASPFGVLDMSGNVWEWCLSDYRQPAMEAGKERLSGLSAVARGGSWFLNSNFAQVSFRGRFVGRDDSLGFRICAAPISR